MNTDRAATSSWLALARLVFDIVAPIALYYVLRAEGASYEVALLAGAALPAVGSVVTLVAHRRVDPVAALMVVSLLAALAGSSPSAVLSRLGCGPPGAVLLRLGAEQRRVPVPDGARCRSWLPRRVV